MSSFNCGKCNAQLIDTHKGYVTGCKHYPADESAVKHHLDLYMNTHMSQLENRDDRFVSSWKLGEWLFWQDEEG